MEKGKKIKFKTKKGEILEGEFLRIYIYKKTNEELIYLQIGSKKRLITKKQIYNES